MKKFLTLLVLCFAVVGHASAGIKLFGNTLSAGFHQTFSNASGTSDGKVTPLNGKTGKISLSSDGKTLTLENVQLECQKEASCLLIQDDNTKIKFIGTCEITQTAKSRDAINFDKDDIHVTLEGEGLSTRVTCTGKREGIFVTKGSTLTVNNMLLSSNGRNGSGIDGKDGSTTTRLVLGANTYLYANGNSGAITDMGSITKDESLDFRDFCYLDKKSHKVCNADGTVAKEITISTFTDCGLSVHWCNLHYENYTSLGKRLKTDGLISDASSISYTPTTKTLKLNNCNIQIESGYIGIENRSCDGLKLSVTGTNSIYITGTSSSAICSFANMTIEGPGTITLKGAGTSFVYSVGDFTIRNVTVNCLKNISCNRRTPIFENCTFTCQGEIFNAGGLSLKGCDIANEGCFYNRSKMSVIDEEGNIVKGVSIKPCTGYGVYILGREITSLNYKKFLCDGLSSGSIGYNNSSKMLTLNRVTLTNPSNYTGDGIRWENAGTKTINIIGTNKVTSKGHAFSLSGNVTFNGYNSGEGTLEAKSTSYNGISIINNSAVTVNTVTLNGGNLTFDGYQNGLYGYGSTTLAMKKNNNTGTFTFTGSLNKAVYNVKDLTLTDVDFVNGAYFDSSKKAVCDKSGNMPKGALVKCVKEYYGLQVAGVRLNDLNCNSFGSPYLTGSASYNPSTKTLTLTSSKINSPGVGIYNTGVDGLIISCSGTNTINTSSAANVVDLAAIYTNKNTTIKGGTLILSGDLGRLCITGGSLMTLSDIDMTIEKYVSTMTNGSARLAVNLSSPSQKVSVQGSVGPMTELTLNDNTFITSPEGAKYDPNKKYIVNSSGAIAGNILFQYLKTPTISSMPKAISGLKYADTPQPLITAGSVTGGTFMYALDDGDFSTYVPKAKDAGRYTVSYKVVGNSGYKNLDPASINVSIGKATPVITAPTPVSGLAYNSAEQALVTPGSTSGGTLVYSFDKSTILSAVPSGKAAGAYKVYYKVVGDDNYTDVDWSSVDVNISRATLTVSAGNYSKKQGDPMPEFKATYAGFKGSDNESVLQQQPTLTCLASASSAPGQYTVRVDGVLAADYNINYVDGMLTVVDADQVAVTAKSYTITYGDDIPALEYESAGAALSGQPELSCAATSSSPVGTYPINVSQGSVSNYNVKYVSGTLIINPATVTVVADAKTKTYGEPDPELTYQVTGLRNGDVLTGGLTRVDIEDVGTYNIIAGSLSAGSNYHMEYTGATLTITKAVPQVTAPAVATLSYDGTPQPLLTSPASTTGGIVEYSLDGASWTTDIPTATEAGNYTTYYRVFGGDNYEDVEQQSVSATMVKAPLTIKGGSYTKKQGEENPEFTLTYEGFKNQETEAVLTQLPAVTTEVKKETAPGKYEITISGAEAANYVITYVMGELTVTDADPIVLTANSYTREYGEENPEFEFTTEGAELDGIPEIECEASASSPAGTYDIVIKKGGVNNYNDTYVNGTLTITKAPLKISVESCTRKQGEKNPQFSLIYEGFKNQETEAVLTKLPVVTTEATKASEPGVYELTISGAEAANYDIHYVTGNMMVTFADPIVLTANSYTREYGDENPAFEFTTEGAALDGEPVIECEATATSPVGTYDIVIKKGGVNNYNDTYVNGTLTITKAPLKVTVKDVVREQGEDNPQFELVYEGWKQQDTESVLAKKPVATTTAKKDSPVGDYEIAVDGGEAQNYELSYEKGKLTVTVPSEIGELLLSGRPFDVYTPSGLKVRHQVTTLDGLPQGVYIIEGKKILVRDNKQIRL